ncbi:MAG TPA: helix-turn-helix transcriptional regulator [bacterium]|nr:helix-turn-helix transcriptional regulator [bacterium]
METVSPFIFAGFSGAAIICAFILFFVKDSCPALKTLGVLLLVFAVDCAFTVFMLSRGYRTFPHLLGLSRPLIFLYGPLFFLTFSVATGYHSKVKADHFFHFLPFAAHFFLMTPFIIKTPATKIFLYEHYVKGVAYIEYYPHAIMFIITIFFSIYSVLPLILTYKFKKTVMGFYSTIDTGKILKLYALSSIYILSSIYLIYIFYGYLSGPSFIRPDIPHYFLYSLAALIFPTVFMAITDLSFLKFSLSISDLIFEDIPADKDKNGEKTEEPAIEKYHKNKIPDELAQKGFELLKEVMAEKNPFTDSNLTLVDLAEMIHIRPYHLSQLINSRTGDNFYVFINSARIKYAAGLFKDPEHNEKSILEIAYMSGFNSKSAFNTYFKNIMGETPSNFRKKKFQDL